MGYKVIWFTRILLLLELLYHFNLNDTTTLLVDNAYQLDFIEHY